MKVARFSYFGCSVCRKRKVLKVNCNNNKKLFSEKAQSPYQLRGQAQMCVDVNKYEANVPEGGMDLLGI